MKTMFRLLVAALLVVFGVNAQQPVVIDDGGSAVVLDTALSNLSKTRNISLHGIPVVRTVPITVKVSAHYGPFVGDSQFLPFARDVVSTLMTNGVPKTQIGSTLLPSHLTGNPVLNTIWFTIEASSLQAFTPDSLLCEIYSSPNNLLWKTNMLNDPQSIYADTSAAEVWNSDGTKKSVTSGGWNSQPVNKFVFLGVPSKTFNASSDAEVASNSAWLLAFPNFTLTGKWSIWENGAPAALGSKIIETRPPVIVTGNLQISRSVKTNTYAIKLPRFSAGLAEFQSADTVSGPWISYGKYPSGAEFDYTGNRPIQLFRVLIE